MLLFFQVFSHGYSAGFPIPITNMYINKIELKARLKATNIDIKINKFRRIATCRTSKYEKAILYRYN